ncbi:sulfite oxidase-like oxidoreductase [Azospirillum rugosum]|uniref:DMSO/TMAO reductase YedYZ molybdopterin-dependent catalytic subunit n=1 Tax=Azospirillum rugosum TaxID=416170 RepID=A0ABS4SND7_9PROT|nr:sulfite oxidase-like oxidoreductase [Azospirillum rugosum]MBP2293997.1 DMSO/TMAO reductase YedYZ molybdopterin-dependent catalytic subunit [Azospirillum rugosum]MDQ0526816.1 DMSO/TMAO reductase YedYZ molybdopterin-dependent catalytic subunit [Azospirillum rugosum]
MAPSDGEIEKDGQIREKLVATKEKWAQEGRALTGHTADPARERLPPGQRLVEDWPVLDLGVVPRVTTENWTLAVDGLVENPVTWRWADFQAQPQESFVSDIHCVTTWSRYDNRWEGVSARRLLSVVKPKPEARFVVCHSSDGYTTNLPLDAFADEDVLLATTWEGQPISRDHGGPVRVVVPKLYFWKSAKWVKRLEFVAEDRRGYWEVRGYHNEADPWKEERYSE